MLEKMLEKMIEKNKKVWYNRKKDTRWNDDNSLCKIRYRKS